MKEFTIQVTIRATLTARNLAQAEERANLVEQHTRVDLPPRCKWLDNIEFETTVHKEE